MTVGVAVNVPGEPVRRAGEDPEVVELELPDMRTTALVWGPEHGRVALCVHGFPDSAWTWRRLAPLLADQGFRVVAPFTRGYAPTTFPGDGDYHLGALMHDLVDIHTLLGNPTDAVLVGHDWGGWTTNALAASPESPFAAHVSLALPPVASVDPRDHGWRRRLQLMALQLWMSWYILFFQLPWLPESVLAPVIGRLWRDWSPAGAVVEDDVTLTLRALPTRRHRKAAVSYYRAMFRNTRPLPRHARLHARRMDLPIRPLLSIHGALDGAMHIAWTSRIVERLVPGSRVVVVEEAGHFVQLDRPQHVATAIVDHLATLETPEESP